MRPSGSNQPADPDQSFLRDDVVHVKLAFATALMAIARNVIVFDFVKRLTQRRSWILGSWFWRLGISTG